MKEFLDKFSQVKVLVIGDLMLDLYLTGAVDRVSPEAPVPILHLEGRKSVLGGAANVAANAASLGASVRIAGSVGLDSEGAELVEALEKTGIDTEAVVRTDKKRTTVKTRLIAQHHQLARFDAEDRAPLTGGDLDALLRHAGKSFEWCDVAVISDYAKGTVTDDLLERLITERSGPDKQVLVDPKGADFSKYRGATLLTPNEREAMAAAGYASLPRGGVTEVGEALREHFGLPGLLITLGEKGMLLLEKEREPFELIAHERKVFDVTGAGDTVIATMAVALGSGADARISARLANLAAGCVVERLGTAVVRREDLLSELEGGERR